jgi:signal transduction histidine kinase/integral membrane sensor domain MASE1
VWLPVIERLRRWVPWLPAALLIALGYYLGAKIGFALTLQPIPVSTLWPPNAILLAGLLLTPLRSWGGVLVSVFVVHVIVQVQSGVPAAMLLCWFVSNCTEALIGALLVRRFTGERLAFDRVRQVAVFLVCAGCLGPFLSSFLDVALVMLNQQGGVGFWSVWQTRFFSNALATLTLVPVIVGVADLFPWVRSIPPRRWIEAAAGGIALLAICWVLFVLQEPGPGTSPALLYAPLPLLVGAAVRFGPLGAGTSLLVCALVAIWGAIRGQGPFVAQSPQENALAIQLFLIVTWIPVMSLAALIRERARAVDQARQSEKQLGLALDAARLGRWEWDIQSNRASWSDETRRMFTAEDDTPDTPVTLERFEQAVHPDDWPMVSRAVSHAVEHSGVLEVEFRAVGDAGPRWILTKGTTLYDDDGRPARMVGINMDITERKRTELRIHELQRALAHLDRVSLAGELSVALAHEINQPLAAILTNARAAKRFLAHDPPNLQQVGEILEAIADDDQRAADVIRRLHALLRKDQARWQPVSINAVVSDVVGIARADAISRGVALVTELTDGLPVVTGDRIQLQQLLLNLVTNACEAMGAVAAGVRRISIATGIDAAGAVFVSVTDSGTGIPAERIQDIFEPFVTSKTGGLGLGLTICRSIVDAHAGQLWAHNNAQGGASLYFTIPVMGLN